MDTENGREAFEEAQRTLHEKVIRGRMKLVTPIRAGGKDLEELEYDFGKLTGWEYAEAMDMDANAGSVLKITRKQAFCLFAQAAGKATDGVDARDIRERLGMEDAKVGVELATLFLNTSARWTKGAS